MIKNVELLELAAKLLNGIWELNSEGTTLVIPGFVESEEWVQECCGSGSLWWKKGSPDYYGGTTHANSFYASLNTKGKYNIAQNGVHIGEV